MLIVSTISQVLVQPFVPTARDCESRWQEDELNSVLNSLSFYFFVLLFYVGLGRGDAGVKRGRLVKVIPTLLSSFPVL